MAHLRVLVADDDPAMRALWTRLLEEELGAEVVTAGDGAAAIALLCEDSFDLLVTDLRMPRVSGMDVLRYARARWPYLPAFLVTGEASPFTVEEARRLGVDVLAKPFQPGPACELITSAVASARASARRVDGSTGPVAS